MLIGTGGAGGSAAARGLAHASSLHDCAPPPTLRTLHLQAAVVSALAFTVGAFIPLLAGAFITDHQTRLACVTAAAAAGLTAFGLLGSSLGGAKLIVGALRVLIGGLLAMAITYGVGRVMGVEAA